MQCVPNYIYIYFPTFRFSFYCWLYIQSNAEENWDYRKKRAKSQAKRLKKGDRRFNGEELSLCVSGCYDFLSTAVSYLESDMSSIDLFIRHIPFFLLLPAQPSFLNTS